LEHQLCKIGQTHTIQAVPAPTVTVYDLNGTVLADENGAPLNAVLVTGYDIGPRQTVRAWWTPSAALTATLPPTSPADADASTDHEPRQYTAGFDFVTIASDEPLV
jgi:hypothetical protein